MLHLQDIESGYGGSTVLRRVNLRVEAGQVVCLMGLNGVGKTTLLKTVMGLLRVQSGTISFANSDITSAPSDRRARAGIGYVPQGREIFPQLSVEQNLILGLEALRGRPEEKGNRKSEREKIPDIVFDMFPILGKMLTRKGGDLSGGQQQQLAIGRALASKPKLLLLDEPMEGIQPSVVQQIEGVIETLKKQKEIAVLLVEQSLGFATTIADYAYILNHGSVVAEGNGDTLNADAIRKHLTV